MKDNLKIKGKVKIIAYTKDGKVKEVREVNNLIVTAGKNYLASFLAADPQSGTFMKYTAIGTGTNSPSSSDTALQSEHTRAAGTLSSQNNSWKNTTTNTVTSNVAITEAGLFSAAAGGTMFSRVVFSPVNLSSGEKLTTEWTITFS
ncbi:MAG: hypothetical protein QXX45_03300 [Candidatus Aenigmatarchaeota archaeon]